MIFQRKVYEANFAAEFGCPLEYVFGWHHDLHGSFDRLSADGKTAIFRIKDPYWPGVQDFSQMYAAFMAEVQYSGLQIWIKPDLETSRKAVECDPTRGEISLPWKDMYNQYFASEREYYRNSRHVQAMEVD